MTAPKRYLPIAVLLFLNTAAMAQSQRWSEKAANDWYRKQPWLVGSNYIPATAINQLEMWQADTFDPARINLELTWAEDLGMNTMRVFLHDLPWQQDAGGSTLREAAIALKLLTQEEFDRLVRPDKMLAPEA